MMISDLDIYRAANLLIKQHGAEAEFVAAQRADQMLDRGDVDGVQGAGSGGLSPRYRYRRRGSRVRERE